MLREVLEGDAEVVAPLLLNKLFVSTVGDELVSGRVVEVEAYSEDDPASHTYPGPTARNAAMFGPAGHLYVYLSYGIHHCANVVCGPPGRGQAVLLRALEPVDGIDVMRRRRGDRPQLADGPGKLCEALGITLTDYGADLCDPGGRLLLVDDRTPPPADPVVGPRVGITKAVDAPWRFRVPA
ncbi:MAG: DNA-3-methyladenine glycosylase [Ilumatobacteraceae bacterium]